jgi:TetR/AcrR family transcriptional regulator, tetracycline repressor protein
VKSVWSGWEGLDCTTPTKRAEVRVTLTRDAILDACEIVVARDGAAALSLRRLGTQLGADATAVYRHFRNKEDLLRALGDRIHAHVVVDLPRRGSWQHVLRTICIRLRAAHLEHGDLAVFVRAGPPMQPNEFSLTEVMLSQLHRAKLNSTDIALAYHALIELTVASAAIDGPMAASTEADRARTYRRWRAAYAELNPADFPHATVIAPHLYATSAEHRFAFALDLLLAGIAGLANGQHSPR